MDNQDNTTGQTPSEASEKTPKIADGPYKEVALLRQKLSFQAAEVGKEMGVHGSLITSLERNGDVPTPDEMKAALKRLDDKRREEIFA